MTKCDLLYSHCILIFKYYFTNKKNMICLQVLLDKSKLPNDIDSLSASDQELFRIYRQDIADTIVNN